MQYAYIAHTNIVRVYIRSRNSYNKFTSTAWPFSNVEWDTLRICPTYAPHMQLKALYNILYLLNTLNSKKNCIRSAYT